MNDFEFFRHYASELASPSSSSLSGSGTSTQRLKMATSWFESMRKSSVSFSFFLSILRSLELSDYEYLLSSQSLLWICKRSAYLDNQWLPEILSLLFPLTSDHHHGSSPTHLQQSSILTNLYSSVAALMLRLFPFPSQQSLQDLYGLAQWNSHSIFLQILLRIPELCLSPELYHGTKEEIQENLIMKSSSLFHEISFVSSFLDSLIPVDPSDIDELILQFAMASDPSAEKAQVFSSIFTLVTDWLNISKHLVCEYHAVVNCQCADLILSSRWLQLLDRCFQYLSQPNQGIYMTERQNELLQISSEVESTSQISLIPFYAGPV
jgi:hypothetical protein